MTNSGQPQTAGPVPGDRSRSEALMLTAAERGNPATLLDRRHPTGVAWTAGNHVEPLIHGSCYFSALIEAVAAMRSGDLLLFTDWRGDPDERLNETGVTVAGLLGGAAARGVLVRGLVWRSHLDRLAFSSSENRHLGEQIEQAGGICLLDMRVRPGGSHHQKFVVLRHPGRPELDAAFVGGIDLCHSRRDDAAHQGDAQIQPMAAVFGGRPPWHDIQLRVKGPAVGDVEAVFRERWDDTTPLTMSPVRWLRDRLQHLDPDRRRLPEQLPDPTTVGRHQVQLLRTYPPRRRGYPFAPDGERSVARGVAKAIGQARTMIYVEDQYLWSREVAADFALALRAFPELLFVAIVPRFPDQDGRWSEPPNLVGRYELLRTLLRAGGERVAVYSVENAEGTPIYVHAKACIVDDVWASVGSDNLNRRSWTHDSELSCAVTDEDGSEGLDRFATALRTTLAAEHLGRQGDDDTADLAEPRVLFAAFAAAAAALDHWHKGGQLGTRPPGQLRHYPLAPLSATTRAWATPLYRAIYDPDGRRRAQRRAGGF